MKNFIIIIMCLLSLLNADDKKKNIIPWPNNLPVYDHIVIVVEENKDFYEVIGNEQAPYINGVLAQEGAVFSRMFGEEHWSQGNYFWLFSGYNQNVGFYDKPLTVNSNESNLGYQLIKNGRTFKGYAESLPNIGSKIDKWPENCNITNPCTYARKHVPWISFNNVPNGTTVKTSSNLRWEDFPSSKKGFHTLPTVSFVIPNLDHDMHNCFQPSCLWSKNKQMNNCINKGDEWLKEKLNSYYQWAKKNNSLLILTFDENDDKRGYHGLTNPMLSSFVEGSFCDDAKLDPEYCEDLENRVLTIFAGAHIKPGLYAEGRGITHVNILRTIESMYKLPKSGRQQANAAGFGITDDYIITDVFEQIK